MPLDLIATLGNLVALPSVNPMGRTIVVAEFYEYRVTDYIERLLARFQIPTCRQPIAPLRENLLARLDGDVHPEAGGELLLFEAHQDTVGVEGMTIDPWAPTIRDGRLYGRGSCDVKGGLAAMLGAMVRLADERAKPRAGGSGPRPTVVLACTVNEEHGFSGAKGLCRLWSEASAGFLPRPPDAAIVAEPTQLKIVVAHKGMVRWRCHAHGRAAHSSNPALGDNAIYRMARVVDLLERYSQEILPRQGDHPLCGQPTLSVGTIVGGSGVNTVPDRCTIEIDHRLLPGDDPHVAWRQAVDYVSAAVDDAAALAHIEHESPLLHSAGLSDEANGPLADRLASTIREITGTASRIGVPFGTNAAIISAAGVPTVVFGPGSIEQAHTADEWIALDQLPQASEILYRMMTVGLR
jgi:acetylornithine deacetylase/succinyl-diaminopimelate desuccinylase-like protein